MHNALLTVAQVCERLQLKRTEPVLRLIRSGELPAADISCGKRPLWRIREADVTAFLEARQAVPVPKPSRRNRNAGKPAKVIEFF